MSTSPARVLSALVPLALLSACSGMDMGMDAGAQDVGVTAGGAQDIGLAREIIEAGYIPSAETFTAEGLLSEHDLPLAGKTCDDLLCPRAAAAHVLPVDDRDERLLVQLGFGTRYEQEPFERGPLDLALCVDISGSMAGDKMKATRIALQSLVDQLGPEDHVSLVAFDDNPDLRFGREAMSDDNRERLRGIIAALTDQGGTNIEAGMAVAYDQIPTGGAAEEDAEGASSTGRRLMLFTDARPNVGDTSANGFLAQARAHADRGVGISVFGLGLDLGTELATEISEVRGGNHFTLLEPEAIEAVFDEEFDYLVTPVAYDLEVAVAPGADLVIEAVHGAPLDDAMTEVRFGASTLFLSSGSGGMGLLLGAGEGGLDLSELEVGAELARFHMSYEDAASGELIDDELAVRWLGGEAFVAEVVEGHRADDEGVFKMAALLDEFDALRAGAAFCEQELSGGVAADRMGRAQDRMEAVDMELGEQSLAEDHQLVGKLRANLSHGSSRCW